MTRHGPVELSRRAIGFWRCAGPRLNPARSSFPFLELNRASNWTEFTAAVARFPGPGQNFVYADVDGNIGYHAAGQLPIRKNYEATFPWTAARAISNGKVSFRSSNCPHSTIRRKAGLSRPIRIHFRTTTLTRARQLRSAVSFARDSQPAHGA